MDDTGSFKATVTEALAATVVDDSQRGDAAPKSTGLGADSLPEAGDLVGGHYRLVRLLGKGMFGRVYVAERIDVPEHQVALKVVPREVYSGRNVERELVMLAAASHPNIVQLKDHGMADGYVWLTMPVYEGETLAKRLERGTLTLVEAYEIFLPIARALEALHKAGLRHQDIKPENIYLATFAGRLHPILLDLGVAAEREATFVAGTILFASPEQLLALMKSTDKLPLSEKMDTYCLGATVLMALVGPALFPGDGAESRFEIAKAHDVRATQPLSPDALPTVTGRPRELINRAIARWLDPDPTNRPSVSEMAEELDVLLEQEREEALMAQRRLARQKTVRRVTFGAMIGLGVIGGLIGYSKRETLRLANELNKVRAEGAESFDKLDTCVASHRLSQRESQVCRDARNREQNEFKSTLNQIAHSGTTSESEHARQVQQLQTQYLGRLKACEEEATKAARSHVDEREKLIAEFGRKEAQLVAERDELKKTLETRASEMAGVQGDRDKCRADLAACETYSESIQPSKGGASRDRGAIATPGPTVAPAPPPPAPPPSPPPATPVGPPAEGSPYE